MNSECGMWNTEFKYQKDRATEPQRSEDGGRSEGKQVS